MFNVLNILLFRLNSIIPVGVMMLRSAFLQIYVDVINEEVLGIFNDRFICLSKRKTSVLGLNRLLRGTGMYQIFRTTPYLFNLQFIHQSGWESSSLLTSCIDSRVTCYSWNWLMHCMPFINKGWLQLMLLFTFAVEWDAYRLLHRKIASENSLVWERDCSLNSIEFSFFLKLRKISRWTIWNN